MNDEPYLQYKWRWSDCQRLPRWHDISSRVKGWVEWVFTRQEIQGGNIKFQQNLEIIFWCHFMLTYGVGVAGNNVQRMAGTKSWSISHWGGRGFSTTFTEWYWYIILCRLSHLFSRSSLSPLLVMSIFFIYRPGLANLCLFTIWVLMFSFLKEKKNIGGWVSHKVYALKKINLLSFKNLGSAPIS